MTNQILIHDTPDKQKLSIRNSEMNSKQELSTDIEMIISKNTSPGHVIPYQIRVPAQTKSPVMHPVKHGNLRSEIGLNHPFAESFCNKNFV